MKDRKWYLLSYKNIFFNLQEELVSTREIRNIVYIQNNKIISQNKVS